MACKRPGVQIPSAPPTSQWPVAGHSGQSRQAPWHDKPSPAPGLPADRRVIAFSKVAGTRSCPRHSRVRATGDLQSREGDHGQFPSTAGLQPVRLSGRSALSGTASYAWIPARGSTPSRRACRRVPGSCSPTSSRRSSARARAPCRSRWRSASRARWCAQRSSHAGSVRALVSCSRYDDTTRKAASPLPRRRSGRGVDPSPGGSAVEMAYRFVGE